MAGHRDAGGLRDARQGARRRYVKREPQPPVFVTPAHGGGLLRRGGTNRGGSGRPTNELRIRMRFVASVVLDEIERRLAWARRPVLTRAELEQMPRKALEALVLEHGEWLAISTKALRDVLDVALKYGLGTRHLHAGDEDAPIGSGVIILPALDSENGGIG